MLLDTHAFLWWIMDDPKLPADIRDFIGDGHNELLLSAASCWEIAIKAGIGRIRLPGKPDIFIPEQMVKNAIEGLPIQISHTLQVLNLPDYHRDPFDRIIVAQAQLEGIPILTSDDYIIKYDVTTIWD